MNPPKSPEEIRRESTSLSEDGAGQQSKVGRPYDGKGDVQTGVEKKLQREEKPKRDRTLRED